MKNEVAAGRIESAYEQPRATVANPTAPKSESCKPGQNLGTSEIIAEVENEVTEPVAPGASVGAAIGESTGRQSLTATNATRRETNMKVDTDQYRAEHGKNPSPKQFGMWIFGIGRNGAWTEETLTEVYSLAQREVKRIAKGLGATDIVVRP